MNYEVKKAVGASSGRRFVGLRHDVDTVYGLRWGLPKLVVIEKKHDVRSTFFVRVDVVRSDKDRRVLQRLADDGWEIGLHLINTISDSRLMAPESELKLLKNLLAVPVHGVTPCGSTIGFRGDATWKTMDALGLDYMEGMGVPDSKVNTFVVPTHLSLDIHYVRHFGEEEGYRRFKEDLLHEFEADGLATVLVHPEWFVRSVGGSGLVKIPLTLLRRKMMNKVYDKFLHEFRARIEFKRYIDLYHLIKKDRHLNR